MKEIWMRMKGLRLRTDCCLPRKDAEEDGHRERDKVRWIRYFSLLKCCVLIGLFDANISDFFAFLLISLGNGLNLLNLLNFVFVWKFGDL